MAKKQATAPAASAVGPASAPASAGQPAGSGEGAEQGTHQGITERANAGTEQVGVNAHGGQGESHGTTGDELAQDARANDAEASKTAVPEREYPIKDVLRNNGSGEFACRATGLFLSPGASQAVTIRDARHLAVLAEAIAVFDRTQPRAGLLKFDRVAL